MATLLVNKGSISLNKTIDLTPGIDDIASAKREALSAFLAWLDEFKRRLNAGQGIETSATISGPEDKLVAGVHYRSEVISFSPFTVTVKGEGSLAKAAAAAHWRVLEVVADVEGYLLSAFRS